LAWLIEQLTGTGSSPQDTSDVEDYRQGTLFQLCLATKVISTSISQTTAFFSLFLIMILLQENCVVPEPVNFFTFTGGVIRNSNTLPVQSSTETR
jgi:hypothetical protein